MKAEHTPGPWSTLREGFSAIYVEARIEGGMLQEVAMCGPTEEGQTQQEANARLIASAPDLLEALNAVEGAYQCGADLNTVMDQVKSAIAKANGESQ